MKKILIVSPNWIGDAVMIEPLINAVHMQFQPKVIDVLARTWVLPIIHCIPNITNIIESPILHRSLQLKACRKLVQILSKNCYDAAYVLPNSFKAAIIPWLSNIPIRIGYRGEMRFGLINRMLPNPENKKSDLMYRHYLALANVERRSKQIIERKPILICRETAKNSAKNFLIKLEIKYRFLIVLCPGTEYGPAKQWPNTHFKLLTKLIINQYPDSLILFLGSEKEYIFCESVISHLDSRNILNLCGVISLEEAISFISIAAIVISNDSGLMHVAAAVSTPQIAIFGSSDPNHTPPLSNKAKIHWLHLNCSPCFRRTCIFNHYNCLMHIKPEDVFHSLNLILNSNIYLTN